MISPFCERRAKKTRKKGKRERRQLYSAVRGAEKAAARDFNSWAEPLTLLTQLDTIFGVSNHFLMCANETFGKTRQTKAANFSFLVIFFLTEAQTAASNTEVL